MAVQVTNYQCPACTGPLQFDGTSGKLKCEYCASSYDVEEIEALYEEKDEKAAQAFADSEDKDNGSLEQKTEGEWDMSDLQEDWGQEGKGMKVYNCPSCTAELVCDETTSATECPYCGNPSIVPGQFTGMLKPHYVIPFKLDKKAAMAGLKKHYEGRPLLPKEFKTKNHLEEIKGVYVPFWLYDGVGTGDMHFKATRSSTRRSGNYEITTTKHYSIHRSGNVAFERIPVDGSKKMPDDYMDSIEPFNYNELKEFSTAYLPGFMADKYDVTAEEAGVRADKRAMETVERCLRDTVRGYDTVIKQQAHLGLKRGAVKYALLPVWILNTKWNGQDYLFAMNGQTGKFVGKLPIDKKKRMLIFWIVYIIVAIITAFFIL